MRNAIIAAALAVSTCLAADVAEAALFSGYSETTDVFFDGTATFDYDPAVLGGSIFDDGFRIDIQLSADLSSGALALLDASFLPLLEGDLSDSLLDAVADGSDSFSMLFALTAGPAAYAVATFTGDLDASGATRFFDDGVAFAPGTLRIVGATREVGVIPLPAGLLLLGSGLAGLGLVGARRNG